MMRPAPLTPAPWTARRASRSVLLAMLMGLAAVGGVAMGANPADEQADAAGHEDELLSRTRQLTFEGRRAGEGYFSRNGSQMVFQSEREPGNPFFQIYLLDLTTGDSRRVSPGHGKTTCAWIHPEGDKVLFASTHADARAVDKQQEELALRASGKQRRYSWDYDEHFELYEFDQRSGDYHALTDAQGYDAEGSWSPHGEFIAFASNRAAYAKPMSATEQRLFELDPAVMNDIYLMRADGSQVTRLTDSLGYDGGPFFSPDGRRICWRRFTPDGATAEVWTMNTDGSDKRQLTRLRAMSWAPFYHPSGRYLIFTTNRHGFANFELYLVDAEGRRDPVRVTNTEGFDGLPVFTPDGKRLCWTANRTADRSSQLFLANWDHVHACRLLGLAPDASGDATAAAGENPPTNPADAPADEQAAAAAARAAGELSSPAISADDLRRHVEYLCRDELAGRMTGTQGERLATAYVAACFERLGLEPAGDDGGWFQPFEFTSGVSLGSDNQLAVNGAPLTVDRDWRPLAFSGQGRAESAPLVFAGYGIVADAENGQEAYDSYVHLDVKDKWVVVLRYLPEDVTPEKRQQLSRPSQLQFKATFARDRGAHGLIVVTGPNAQSRSELVPLRKDRILAGSSLPVVSVSNEVAAAWFASSGKSLAEVQDGLDTGDLKMGFDLPGVAAEAAIDIKRIKEHGRNVLARLPAGDSPGTQAVVLGAHVDHLGQGLSSSSLARDSEEELIHYGADDNASGVAAMLEIAEHFVAQRGRGALAMRRDLVFAAWSGEELGLLGSDHYVDALVEQAAGAASAAAADPTPERSLSPTVAACLNMDMVGRLEDKLVLQGVGSSGYWRRAIERRNTAVGLPLVLQDDSYLPTDASPFYLAGVPILSAFTGAHSDYHTPRDTPEKLNYEGAAEVATLVGLIARDLTTVETPPDYILQTVKKETSGGRLRAYLGTIPDYAAEVVGVKLSGVGKDGPADLAGMQAGDVIVGLAGKQIENIYDYTNAIEGLKIGEAVEITVRRDGQPVTLEVTPASRD